MLFLSSCFLRRAVAQVGTSFLLLVQSPSNAHSGEGVFELECGIVSNYILTQERGLPSVSVSSASGLSEGDNVILRVSAERKAVHVSLTGVGLRTRFKPEWFSGKDLVETIESSNAVLFASSVVAGELSILPDGIFVKTSPGRHLTFERYSDERWQGVGAIAPTVWEKGAQVFSMDCIQVSESIDRLIHVVKHF